MNKLDKGSWGGKGTYMAVPQLLIYHRVVQEIGGGRQYPKLLACKASLAQPPILQCTCGMQPQLTVPIWLEATQQWIENSLSQSRLGWTYPA